MQAFASGDSACLTLHCHCLLSFLLQGLATLSGKRSATGVPTDDNGMTSARSAGQVRLPTFSVRLQPEASC